MVTQASREDAEQIDDAIQVRAGFDTINDHLTRAEKHFLRGLQLVRAARGESEQTRAGVRRLTQIPYIAPDHRPAA